jgi:hypothetical protein
MRINWTAPDKREREGIRREVGKPLTSAAPLP